MTTSYKNFEDLIKMNMPEGSAVKGIELKEKYTSLYAIVKFKVTEQYQEENCLIYPDRIMEIRLIKGEQDESLPISSCADRTE